ncbi:MAG TPA: hypothetical protein VF411_14760 [Bacteroidia bacterium]
MEQKVKTEEVIYSFLQKNDGINIAAIESGTGIFKLNIHKVLKKLVESKKVVFNEESKIYMAVAIGEETSKSDKSVTKPATKKKAVDVKEKDEATLIGGRDTSKYIFNKVAYPKSRLVLNLLKYHISKNPTITLPILQMLFKDVKNRYGIIVPLAEAQKVEKSSGRPRHFLKSEDLIVLQGRKMACNSQWDSNNFKQFCAICKTLKYEIKKQQ